MTVDAVESTGDARGTRRLPAWVRSEVLWAVLAFVAVSAISWLRVPALDQQALWAEDGPIFLKQQLEGGFLSTILQPYAGYQHFLPRLFSAVISGVLPLEHFDRGVFVACIAFAGFVGAATFRLSRGILRWLPARFLVALVPAMVPLFSREIIGDLANLHTYCLWLVAWIAVSKVTSRWEGAFWAVVALAACLTEFQAVVVIPFLLIALIWDRSLARILIVVGAVAGAAVQVFTWLNYPRGTESDEVLVFSDVVIGWLANAILPLWSADAHANARYLAENGTDFLWLGLVPLVIAVLISLVLGKNRERFALLTLLLVSGATFAGSLIVNPFWFFQFSELRGDHWLLVLLDLRYGASAGMFALATIPFAASAFVSKLSPHLPTFSRFAAFGAVVLVFAYVAMQWSDVESARSQGKAWTPQWREAVVACEQAPEADYAFGTAPEYRSFELRCADVLARS